MSERNRLAAAIERQRKLEQGLADSLDLAELAEEEGDTATGDEVQRELERIKEQLDRLQLESMLSGEADQNDAFLQVAAGAGGTESQDWAEMLLRMYLRWAEQHGYKTEWIEESEGEEAGIKSATVKILGENAYGWLKTEAGVHRLVRISPFDSNARRHTSFASVTVSPVIDDRIEIEILDKDLKVDTYRASGAGGQHVNRTDWPSASPICRPGSSPPARTTARSTATAPRPWICCAPSSTSWSSPNAVPSPMPPRRRRWTRPSARRSGTTSCTPTRW